MLTTWTHFCSCLLLACFLLAFCLLLFFFPRFVVLLCLFSAPLCCLFLMDDGGLFCVSTLFCETYLLENWRYSSMYVPSVPPVFLFCNIKTKCIGSLGECMKCCFKPLSFEDLLIDTKGPSDLSAIVSCSVGRAFGTENQSLVSQQRGVAWFFPIEPESAVLWWLLSR